MENRSDNSRAKMTVPGIFGTIIFFLSFLPIIYAIYVSYTGIFFGLQGCAWFFGLPAIIIILIYESFLFFLPVGCLIYQIIFFTKYIRRHEKLKITTLILVGIVLTSALISTIFAEQSLDLKHKVYQSKIRTHLTAVCGEKSASEITYETNSRYEMTYNAHSPVLPQDKDFEIRIISEGRIIDTLVETFMEANKDFYPEINKYIVAKEKLPAEFTYNIRIVSIDFQDYKNGDDLSVLLDRTKYILNSVDAHYSNINEEVIMDTIDKVWKDIYPNAPLQSGDLHIHFNNNDKTLISVYIREDRKQKKFIARISDWSRPDFQSPGKYQELDGKEIELKR